jgi:Phosphotransferase enzyme family
VSEQNWLARAEDVLTQHGYATTGLEYIGAGAQSACCGTREIAVLISIPDEPGQVPDLTGHVLPGSGERGTCNTYPVLHWLTGRAVRAGVRTPKILAVGNTPRPYALIERANGILASVHPRSSEDSPAWYGKLGEEIRKTHLVETTGFGLFVPDGSTGYRGRFPTWIDYLDRWLSVHLGVGQIRPESQRVVELFLAQGIVDEHDLATVAAKVREAQSWPVTSVLTHYDNRLDNLVIDAGGNITMLDWGLSLAGIGISQELIKLFETEETSMESPRVAAFLHGYGLSYPESVEAIEAGKLMLVLDGLGMSYGWADVPERLDGIRAWLRTVKRLCTAW